MSAEPTPEFSDHFRSVATQYAANRPGYPDALFDWVAAHSPGRALAWDCATGSDPVAAIEPALAAAWGAPERLREVGWPVTIRAGRV